MPSFLPGVVVSVHNDAAALRQALPALTALFEEIIVVDNHSTDDCAQVCQQFVVTRLMPATKPPLTRGQCWNLGAVHVQSDTILFLHADATIPKEAMVRFKNVWQQNFCDYSCFQIRFQEHSLKFRILEQVSNFRSRFLKIVYGDQGLCIRKKVFEALGGFPNEYLLEDLKMSRHLRKYRFHFVSSPIFPSSRKFHEIGFYRYLFLINQVLLLNLLGVSTKKIYQLYYSRSKNFCTKANV